MMDKDHRRRSGGRGIENRQGGSGKFNGPCSYISETDMQVTRRSTTEGKTSCRLPMGAAQCDQVRVVDNGRLTCLGGLLAAADPQALETGARTVG